MRNPNRIKIDGAHYTNRYAYDTHYEIIWATNRRHPYFKTKQAQAEIKELILEEATPNVCNVEFIDVEADNIYLKLSIRPYKAAADLLKQLKGHSSLNYIKHHPELKSQPQWTGHIWNQSYFLKTLGKPNPTDRQIFLKDNVFNRKTKYFQAKE